MIEGDMSEIIIKRIQIRAEDVIARSISLSSVVFFFNEKFSLGYNYRMKDLSKKKK